MLKPLPSSLKLHIDMCIVGCVTTLFADMLNRSNRGTTFQWENLEQMALHHVHTQIYIGMTDSHWKRHEDALEAYLNTNVPPAVAKVLHQSGVAEWMPLQKEPS